jgi:pimeloyl-ACP methyl ester carboxylesterase
MGGLVALALAESFGKHVAALILVAPLAFPELRFMDQAVMGPRAFPLIGPLLSKMGQATIDRPVVKIAQRMMFAPLPVPAAWEANYPYDQILTAEAMVSEGEETAAVVPFAPAGTIDLSAIRTDVQILIGMADQVANPMRHARPLAAMLSGARLTEVAGVGHMLHHAEPDRVVEAALGVRVFA